MTRVQVDLVLFNSRDNSIGLFIPPESRLEGLVKQNTQRVLLFGDSERAVSGSLDDGDRFLKMCHSNNLRTVHQGFKTIPNSKYMDVPTEEEIRVVIGTV